MYAWANSGVYAFGEMVGNNNADGPFNNMNGSPKVLMSRNTAAGNAWFHQNNLSPVVGNPVDTYINPNTTSALSGANSTVHQDFVANGVKCRATSASLNASSAQILTMAFGIQPMTDGSINQSRAGAVKPYNQAYGGTITQVGGFWVHTFTSSGTFTPVSDGAVDYLVIAGGGGGGSQRGGGGGAGGYLTATGFSVSAQAYAITVGAGGAGGGSNSVGVKGSNSVFSTITSTGGGGGGTTGVSPTTGGSGGGGGAGASSLTGGAAAPSGQGNAGGNGKGDGITLDNGGGGGGSSSSVGGAASTGPVGGNGGAGTASSISGSAITRAAGGGGGVRQGTSGGSGGSGGGGDGGDASSVAGVDATANTGSGGGGGGQNGLGGDGASGIVIIKYAIG
tara:strand:- start:328 stop:1506 length:1179 start_codon:yes stop_codon:yes gene_type:complete